MANSEKGKQDFMDELEFLIGDWKGHGIQHFGNNQSMEFDVRMACRRAEGGNGIEMVEFDDNQDGSMFHGEQSFIFVDEEEGKLRLRRTWFEGGFNSTITFLEDVTVAGGVMVSKFASGNSDFHLSTLRIKKNGDKTLDSDGLAHFDNKDWPLEVTFKKVGEK